MKPVNKLVIFVLLSGLGFFHRAEAQSGNGILPLIPQPEQLTRTDGVFLLNRESVLISNNLSAETGYLRMVVQNAFGFDLPAVTNQTASAPGGITLFCEPSDSNVYQREGYSLSVRKDGIVIRAAYPAGVFYGIQTFFQLLPLERSLNVAIPCLEITDKPRYTWRGMHLDVCRHFFPVSFIKKYIDYLAMYKMNTFHWHLTDDQGWRIEINQYPALTQKGAWRKGSMVGHYNENRFDTLRYGGYYTRDQIREVVAYASDRHIRVVPEIELPGHAMAALAAYPQLSCTGGPFEVERGWGVFDDVFCPKEQTFDFFKNVLNEVMDLFPSEYIHIGGDECPKVRWKSCSHCQELIKKEGLKNEHELQSYIIRRVETYINARGRKMIGWDEILEGGLAPNATVMSWRGTEGGIEAARQKHDVVMCPGSHCYFDHYQGTPKYEPIAIGGMSPVEKVYGYQPTPEGLSASESRYILGAQGNVWTEYIETEQQVEYMALPRMAALAEVVWGTANPKQFDLFRDRLIRHFELLDTKGVNYARSVYGLNADTKLHTVTGGILLNINAAIGADSIRYALNREPLNARSQRYLNPLEIRESTKVKAAVFNGGKRVSNEMVQNVVVSKSTGKKITLTHAPGSKYEGKGSFSLVDGLFGDSVRRSGDWIGFRPHNLEAVLDLGQSEPIRVLRMNTLKDPGSWIHYPARVDILVSQDGKHFILKKTLTLNEITKSNGKIYVAFPETKARYVKVKAVNQGTIPPGNPGAGSGAWLFVDELFVE